MPAILEYLKQLPWQKAIMIAILAAVCLLVVKLVLTVLDKVMKKSKLDPLVCKLLRIFASFVLWFMACMVVLSSMGISVTSFIAAFSVIGVAFSLAIQGFLSNVFGGVQIITNKPFKSGDYVEAGGTAGTVREVGLFYTKLETPDKKLVQVPNSQIANDSIINYSSAPYRRVEFLISVSYDCDPDKVRKVLLDLIDNHPLTLDEEGMHPVAHVKEFKDSDICYTARAWCHNKDYWTVYFDIMDAMKSTLEQNGISFTYPHVNVHMDPK